MFCLYNYKLALKYTNKNKRFGFVTEMQYSNESNVLDMS
jgi:hypothetical protein